eukprot:scaffold1410_cov123-Cylindrotheca_fusiformis.AAC.5
MEFQTAAAAPDVAIPMIQAFASLVSWGTCARRLAHGTDDICFSWPFDAHKNLLAEDLTSNAWIRDMGSFNSQVQGLLLFSRQVGYSNHQNNTHNSGQIQPMKFPFGIIHTRRLPLALNNSMCDDWPN